MRLTGKSDQRPNLRGLAVGAWIVVILVCVAFAAAPLWRAGLPLGDDTEIHLYRLVDLDHLLRQGIIYSRWQPDLVYGYGSPLFSYYAPLSAYLVEAAHLLGLSFRAATSFIYGLLPLIAGLSTFAFLRRRLDLGPALVGALAYPTALYTLYDIYVRGSISDAVAMALFPVVLYLFDRLSAKPGPARAAMVGLAYAAALLSHEVTGPMLFPLLVLCGLWWARGSWRTMFWQAGAIALALGLSLFFYGPATLGVSLTRVPWYLAQPGTQFDQHFTSLGDLLIPFATAYPGAMLTNLPIGMGLIPALLGLAALLSLDRLGWRERGEVGIFTISLIVCAFLTIPASTFLWRTLPFLSIMQYPWRLLAMASFVDALLVGYFLQGFLARWPTLAGPAAAILIGVWLALAIPYLFPLPGTGLPANPTLAQVTAFQQRSGALGSTSDAELLPAGLAQLPSRPPFAGADLGASLAAKLDRANLPANASIGVLRSSELQTTLDINTPRSFVAQFSVFWFPNWSASLDGRSVAVDAAGPMRLLAVPVPSGKHTLTISFAETRHDLVFDLTSLLALIVIVGLFFPSVIRIRSLAGIVSPSSARAPGVSSQAENRALPVDQVGLPTGELESISPDRVIANRQMIEGAAVGVVFGLVLLWGVVGRGVTPLVRPFDGQRPPGMAVVADHHFGDSLELLGYTTSTLPAHPGSPLTITMDWKANSPVTTNYSSFVHVVGSDGRTVAQSDNVHVADLPTSRWRPGAYARDVHVVQLPATIASGTYRVDIGLYDRVSGHQLPISDVGGDTLHLLQVTVTPGPR